MPGDKIRVLIVDDVAETRENVRRLLTFEPDFEVIGAARSGREAIQMSDELSPDVVLMDINMPDMDGITATEAIRRKAPAIQVVILSVQNDSNYMRRAMLAGARDFLAKPPMTDELISAIRRAGEMAREERSKIASTMNVASTSLASAPSVAPGRAAGRIVVLYSPKGGTGVTTLAVNLAITLHNSDTPSALVDANLQFGDVAVFLNEQGKNTIADLAPRADELEPDVVDGVIIKHAGSGVHILAAPAKPEHAEQVHGDQFGSVLDYLRRLYAYIVVDTTPTLNDVVLAAIDRADIIVLVATQDIPSVKSARLFLDLLTTLGISHDRTCFVMNKYDKRIAITPEKVGENLKLEVGAVVPLDERIVIPAVNRGVPFVLDQKAQPVSRAVYNLAETVRARLARTEAEPVAVRTRR
jgi:pilus assembly protein CpaE